MHIAGTKGKGSTAAFLSSILRAEGYSVGCYSRYYKCNFGSLHSSILLTAYYYKIMFIQDLKYFLASPHIRTIRERISLGATGELVSEAALNSHFHKIKEDLDKAVELEKGHLSQFEVCHHLNVKLNLFLVLVFIDFVLVFLGLFLWNQGFHCSGIQPIC